MGRKEKNLDRSKVRKGEKGVLGRISEGTMLDLLPPKDLLRRIIWQSVGSAPLSPPLGAKSETIKRGEICSVKRKAAEAPRRRTTRPEP